MMFFCEYFLTNLRMPGSVTLIDTFKERRMPNAFDPFCSPKFCSSSLLFWAASAMMYLNLARFSR